METIMRPRNALPRLDVEKIKILFDRAGIPIYRLAKEMGLSQQTLERMLEGAVVGIRIIDRVARYFKLNSSDIIKRDKKHKDFYKHIDIKETVFVERIERFSDLKSNVEYITSRKNSDSWNQVSHKIYNCEFKSEGELLALEAFLKTFSEIDEMAGTNKTRGQEDISQELTFLRKQMHLDDPIRALEKFNIAVYYGTYYYRAMEELHYFDTSDCDEDGNASEYHYFRPNGKLVEVLIFEKIDSGYFPSKGRIFPSTGYTQDELIEIYKEAYKKIHGQEINRLVEQYIQFHSRTQWLMVKDKPLMEGIQTGPTEFLHPRYFIHRNPNWTLSSDSPKFKGDIEKFNEKSRELREIDRIFAEKTLAFEFVTTRELNSVPKYDGPLQHVTLVPLSRIRKGREQRVVNVKEKGKD